MRYINVFLLIPVVMKKKKKKLFFFQRLKTKNKALTSRKKYGINSLVFRNICVKEKESNDPTAPIKMF